MVAAARNMAEAIAQLHRHKLVVGDINPANVLVLKDVQAAAEKLGVTIQPIEASTAEAIVSLNMFYSLG